MKTALTDFWNALLQGITPELVSVSLFGTAIMTVVMIADLAT